ncbi:hypothetical protein X798_00127 [Onchocerca flexuosa]|uniref:Uncharacterized protein n=1 Tax=Onchocerca flexuosa TaxID=387005 RepID=A0A238C5J8_9BILA|nr:hypothetical protein X798_00127 [Onchocerca flexuosa]
MNESCTKFISLVAFCSESDTIAFLTILTKLFGYYPERPNDLFANSSSDFEASKICGQTSNATTCCNDDRMLFHCFSMEKHTNVTIVQYPKFGYPYCFYPFNKQDGYMQPFVTIQLFNLIPNKRVMFRRINWNKMHTNSIGSPRKITQTMVRNNIEKKRVNMSGIDGCVIDDKFLRQNF